MEDILNTLFPGRSNYTGPVNGWFGFVHHGGLFEYSHDIMERVDYIKRNKPENEIPTRLNHLISLTALSPLLDPLQSKWAALRQEYQSKWDALDQEHQSKRHVLKQEFQQRSALDQEYRSKRDALDQEHQLTVLNYIKQHIPDCAWNGRQLVFPLGE